MLNPRQHNAPILCVWSWGSVVGSDCMSHQITCIDEKCPNVKYKSVRVRTFTFLSMYTMILYLESFVVLVLFPEGWASIIHKRAPPIYSISLNHHIYAPFWKPSHCHTCTCACAFRPSKWRSPMFPMVYVLIVAVPLAKLLFHLIKLYGAGADLKVHTWNSRSTMCRWVINQLVFVKIPLSVPRVDWLGYVNPVSSLCIQNTDWLLYIPPSK
jgi:hypothetical protein